MTPDLWTVAAVALPYAPYLLLAAYKNRRGLYDPNQPRASDAALEGWAARARAAEVNSWEALTQYVALSWLAHAAGADERVLTALGVAWVVARLAYVGAYVAGAGRWRIAWWFVALGLALARFGAGLAAG